MCARRDQSKANGIVSSFAMIAAVFFGCAHAAESGTLLSRDEAVARALERPALGQAIDGAVAMAHADSLRERMWANPELFYSREQTSGPEGTAEDYLWVSERFDVSGRLRLRSGAADERTAALRASGLARRARITAQVSMHFYEVLRHQRSVASVRALIARLEEAVDSVSRREAAGDASAYDRRRIERELSIAVARLAMLDTRRQRAWSKLASLIGDERQGDAPWPRVSGTLLPDALVGRDRLFERMARRPEFRVLQHEANAAELDFEAASRWWVPLFELGGGYKRVDFGAAATDGYLAMLAVTLPLFDRKQDESQRAKAERRRAQAERTLALDEIRVEVRGLLQEAEEVRKAAIRFRREREEGTEVLVRTAEVGYRGGELGVLELLDAYRGAHEDEERLIDLEFRARRARIDLEFSTGGYAHRDEKGKQR